MPELKRAWAWASALAARNPTNLKPRMEFSIGPSFQTIKLLKKEKLEG